jgi:hypothetical protein
VLLNFGVVAYAIFIVLGLLWCREMFGRWRSDLDEYRSTTDSKARTILVVLWVATALILAFLINFLVGILRKFGLL